jgi:hypothetical protein
MIFFVSKCPFKKDDVEKKKFVDNLALLIVKNHLPLQFVKNVVKTFGVAIVSLSSIPFLNFSSHNVLPNLVEKTKQTYVLFLLYECYF